MANVLCNAPKTGEPIRYVDVIDDGGIMRLAVDASLTVGDIQIGAVEIKDHDSGVRADVLSVGSTNGLVIYDGLEEEKIPYLGFGEKIIGASATDTLISKTVTVGKKLYIESITCGGNEYGKFFLFVNTTKRMIMRNSGSNPTIIFKFDKALIFNGGDTIELKAENIYHQTKTYEGNIVGYEV